MIEILRMWVMVSYFYYRQDYLAYFNVPRGEDPEWAERVLRWGDRGARVVAAMENNEKPFVDKQTLKRFFLEFYFMDYWFLQWRIRRYELVPKFAYTEFAQNEAKHLNFVTRVMKNCLSTHYGFFEESKDVPSHVSITVRGEQFGSSPLGLIREWAVYLNPFGFTALAAAVGALFYYFPRIFLFLTNR